MTANQRYLELTKEINENISKVSAKLKQHSSDQKKDSLNWGYVGDLSHYNDQLKNILGTEE